MSDNGYVVFYDGGPADGNMDKIKPPLGEWVRKPHRLRGGIVFHNYRCDGGFDTTFCGYTLVRAVYDHSERGGKRCRRDGRMLPQKKRGK